jgi:uncharacterized protein (TIGR02646 family)
MLRIVDRELALGATKTLERLQQIVDAEPDYPARVTAAKTQWQIRTSTNAKAATFATVRSTLSQMCVGTVRCAYCEDSLADEVEHIQPKTLFPEAVFKWRNYLFACGPCNGPKSNQHGTILGNEVVEFRRGRADPVVPPPAGLPGLIDPRSEDPLQYLDLDIGGLTPENQKIDGTFEFLPVDGLPPIEHSRAKYTIKVLDLNREVLRVGRANAFGGFRARLREFVMEKEAGASTQRLEILKDDLIRTPHLTVFAEMRRQRAAWPDIEDLLLRAPEALAWSLTTPDV